MLPDMIHLVERLVVAVERISQDVNNISAYVYDLSYSVSHLLVEKRENEDIAFVPHDEDDNRPSDTPAAGQEVSTKTEYSSPFEPAGGSSLSHIDELEHEETYVGDTPSMTIDDNEDCVVLSSVSNPVDCTTYMEGHQGGESSGARTCKLGGTLRANADETHATRIHFMVPTTVYTEEKPVSERSFNANSHLLSRGKSFVCSECGKEFTDNYHLIRHTRVHTREKPYRCAVCGSVFTRSDKLTSHMRIHTGEKPYKCSICEYACSRSDKLATHMHIHTRDGPYRCSVCGNAYSQSGGLKAHMDVHTGDCLFACENCGSRFNSSAGLRSHRRLVHSVPSAAT